MRRWDGSVDNSISFYMTHFGIGALVDAPDYVHSLNVLPDAMGDRLSSIDRTVEATVFDPGGGRTTVED